MFKIEEWRYKICKINDWEFAGLSEKKNYEAKNNRNYIRKKWEFSTVLCGIPTHGCFKTFFK